MISKDKLDGKKSSTSTAGINRKTTTHKKKFTM